MSPTENNLLLKIRETIHFIYFSLLFRTLIEKYRNLFLKKITQSIMFLMKTCLSIDLKIRPFNVTF